MKKRTTQTKLILIVSFIAVISIIPFLIYRIVEENWFMVVLNSVIVIGMSLIFIYVYKMNEAKWASVFLVIVVLSGGLFSFYVNDSNAIYWIYPSMMATFFIVKPRHGFIINFVVYFIYLPRLVTTYDVIQIGIISISVFLTNIIAFSFSEGQRNQAEKLRRLASEDYLTKTGNRRALDVKLKKIHKTLKNHDNFASLILLDLDHFKRVNDEHGHLIGDGVLVEITTLLKEQINDRANIFRYGGEEFIVVCEKKGVTEAFGFAESFRKNVKNNIKVAGKPVTISLGVAEYNKEESIDEWIHRVDLALYQAKNQGRDRTVQT